MAHGTFASLHRIHKACNTLEYINNKMIATLMILLGLAGFALCYKSILWFEKI